MEHSINDISNYRYDSCAEALRDAEFACEYCRNSGYMTAINRGYHSIFCGMRAICILEGFDSLNHIKLIEYFNQNYVQTGIFNRGTSDLIRSALESNRKAERMDFYIASKEDAKEQIERAEAFKEDVRKYLVSKGILEDK